MRLTQEQIRKFESDGYIIISDESLDPLWVRVETEISALLELFTQKKLDLFHHDFEDVSPAVQSSVYDRLRYLPGLAAMESNSTILSWCAELGLIHPILMGCSNMRYDRPSNDVLVNWHQDSTYLLGSVNALTVWIPFSEVNDFYGTIAVIPGSHKLGIKKFKTISDKDTSAQVPFLTRDIALDEPVDDSQEVVIEAKRGDLVIFKQMLLHRSVANRSSAIRWTAQLRFSDLHCPAYQKNGFKNGDKHNIFETAYPGFKYPQSN